jgi:serine phosphatase RsbU (regulator of sigma subunit)
MFKHFTGLYEIFISFCFLSGLFIALICLPFSLPAQVNTDSIDKLIRRIKADERPELYLKYAGELSGKNNEVAFEYGQRALAFFVKIGNKIKEADARMAIAQILTAKDNFKLSIDWYQQALKLYRLKNENEKVAMCLNNIGFNNSLMGNYGEAINFYNQSLKLSSGKYPGVEGRSYYNMALSLRKLENPDEAIEKISKSLGLLEKSGDLLYLSKAYYWLGLIYHEKSLYKKSIENYRIADSLKNIIGDLEGRVKTLNGIGGSYWRWGKYENAIAIYQEAIKISEKIGYLEGIASCFNNIALIYDNIDKAEKSLEFHKQALAVRRQLNDRSGIANSLNNIAIAQARVLGNEYKKIYGTNWEDLVYKKIGSQKVLSVFNECLINSNEALRIKDSLNDLGGKAQMFNNIGTIYCYAGEFTLAIDYYKRSLEINKSLNNLLEVAKNNQALGIVYGNIGDFKLGAKYLEEAKEICQTHQINDFLLDIYEDLSFLFEKQGNTTRALDYYKQYSVIKDTLLNKENLKQIAELQTQYETEKKQQQIELLNKDQALKDTRIKQQFYFILFFILVSLLVGALVVLFYRQSKQRKLTNIELERKNELITEQKKEITDSIQYASRLQQAILPPDELLMQLIPRHFIFFRPRDIVSGDYYFIAEKNGMAIIVTADCTGHGVPGALMSMLGTAILNEILGKMTDLSPDHILNELRSQVIRSLHQSGRTGEHRDGMDLALYILDKENKQVFFAGANNPLIIARNGDLIELKPDKMPIGIYEKGNIPFSSQCVPVLDNDMLYTFSDGILDQFGGSNGKKFMIKRFRELLINIHGLEESVQKNKINEAFLEWKSSYDQVDDILVIGVRV